MHDLDRATHMFARGLNKSPSPPRRPWAVAFVLPFALMALLWAATYDLPITSAISFLPTTYAGCGALGPNYFGTIQEAVNNTAPGGVVYICPGNYNESVNLNLMNGSGGTGNITIRKEPSAAGTVNWTSNLGDALYISADFVGDIDMQDLYIHETVRNGINFAIDSLNDPLVITGSVTIANVQTYRTQGVGVYVYATQGITVSDSIADENAYVGFALMGEDPGAPIYLDHLQANDNDLFGILVSHNGAVDLLDSQASENGTLLVPIPFIPMAGVAILPSGSFLDPIGLKSYYASDFLADFVTAGDAAAQGAASSVNVENTEASHNDGFGFFVVSAGASIHFTGATATDNGYDGVAARSGEYPPSGSISVDDSTADQNGWLYLQRKQAGADLTANGISGPSAGFRLFADQIAIDGASAAENQDFGFCLTAEASNTMIVNSNAENNAEVGILQDPDACYLPLYIGAAVAQASGGDVTAQNGLPPSLTISNTTASGNPGNGIEIAAADTVVTVTNVTAKNNGIGIHFDYAPELASVAGSVRIDNSLILSNTDSGIAFEEYILSFPPFTMTVPATIVSNIICENGAGLVVNRLQPAGEIAPAISSPPNITIAADARGNWWGNQSGPTPFGTGNSIISGTGVISATPWIDTFFANAVPNPTIVGVPVDATFRFGDAGESYFLENGVGNLNESPIFSISNSNGDIAAASTVDQFLKDTYLSVTITPSVVGSANVAVTGPCGLTPSIAVPVANPSISVSKSPDLRGVPVGGAAAFTVTIANTGDITLTEIAVTDTLAPNCGRTSGAINDLGPGLNTSYTCDLTVNNSLVNTVQVDAKALVGGEPAGAGVSDTDTAGVKVGSLTLTRTVWVDGYNPACQTIDKSLVKVPSGTTIKYCFTVTNSGDYTFTTHSLNDSRLGAIFGGFAHDLPPGASYSNIDAGFPATETVTADITGVTTWTGTLDGPIVELTPVATAAAAQDQVATTVSRAVALSQPSDDQDGDGIDDITEGFVDVNTNGVPDFLEFTPTGEEEENQPGLPQTLLLPSLHR